MRSIKDLRCTCGERCKGHVVEAGAVPGFPRMRDVYLDPAVGPEYWAGEQDGQGYWPVAQNAGHEAPG